MAEQKMVDADGHIREIESDVFEYFPEHYKRRRDAVLYFRCCRITVGTARPAPEGWEHRF
jgi:hypothetical protein